ncbi:MAG: DNA-3-methyladenine glycosylase I [Hyphomonadaceae bacterium]|nr:DNA-3-methyladenine glycosylase I [Hyphomonadaceae bacterium]MBC6411790.1 DNA-3-methyladenine glycosylase I [Hyphomonadaceae bacterium]
MPDVSRCGWVPPHDPLYTHYHDTEWGRPNYDSKSLFSKLMQDGQQAGLAWITILRKREHMLKVYDNFDPDIVAHYTDRDVERLLTDRGIIRSRPKINAAIGNSECYVRMRDEEGIDFGEFLWSHVGGKPIVNRWKNFNDMPVQSPESGALSANLKNRGFKFVGPVILYAFMQAVGMVNDHEISCHAYADCSVNT